MDLKIGFATCVQLGLSCIEEIYRIDGKLDLIITLEDDYLPNKSGRVYLDNFCTANDIPLLKIKNINDEYVLKTLKEKNIDWLFVIGWSQILKKALLDAPTYGCIGMHPTLLPKGRGRAAIPWAIIKGLKETGVTMFKLDDGVDTGEIIGQKIIQLDNKTTATTLYNEVNQMHIFLINKYFKSIITNNIQLIKQDDSLATIWPGRKPEDGEILPSMTIDEADRYVRALTHPYPGAFINVDNEKIIIWSAFFSKTEGFFKLLDGYLNLIDFQKVKANE